MSDTPAPRIGDVERDQAVAWLRDHLAAGRLSPQEFDDRMTAALQARTMSDLTPLFADLPAPGYGGGQEWPLANTATAAAVAVPADPGSEVEKQPTSVVRSLQVVSAIAWPTIVIANFATGWQLWWLFLIPIFLLPALWKAVNDSRGGQS